MFERSLSNQLPAPRDCLFQKANDPGVKGRAIMIWPAADALFPPGHSIIPKFYHLSAYDQERGGLNLGHHAEMAAPVPGHALG